MQKKTINKQSQVQDKSLSIQFSLDGFSFCVADANTKDIVSFTTYTFDASLATPELLLEKVTAIFKNDAELQHDFTSVHVIHQNNLNTLVPEPYFDKTKLKQYLDYNIKTLASDYITFDELAIINAKNVYVPYVNINNYLFQNFGAFEYQHHATVLIEKLLQHAQGNETLTFFVHVADTQFDIVVIQNNTLLFYNCFNFSSKEDFIYYILFTAEQLELDPNTLELVLLGAIEQESELYEIVYQYIRHVRFISTTVPIFEDTEDFSNHTNFLLIS